MNIIARLENKLAYFDSAVHCFNHYTTRTSPLYEQRPPANILTNNDTAFTCRQFKEFTSSWGVHLMFRYAHIPARNGIMERSHRSIKTIEPGRIVLYWKQSTNTTWQPLIFYVAIWRACSTSEKYWYHTAAWTTNNWREIQKGDIVWVNTPHGRCTTKFGTGHVTEVTSQQSVQVNRTPRLVKDLRLLRGSHPSDDKGDREDDEQPIYLDLGSASGPLDIGGSPTNPDISSESSLKEGEEIQTIPLRRSTQNKRPHPDCHLCDLEIKGECRRCDGQEFESDNNLPYPRHKRACLCLVCKALMQGEN